jgi:hypothetical protein
MKPHKHAEVIKAWADGAEIESLIADQWMVVNPPKWQINGKYRVKPEPEPDIVYYGSFDKPFGFRVNSEFNQQHNKGDQLKITFDGTTKKIKSAEVLK